MSKTVTIGEKIRVARAEKGWSQADLAKRVGVSQATIDKIESGITRQSKFLTKIAVLLDMPLTEVYPEDDLTAEFGSPHIGAHQLLLPGVPAIPSTNRDFPVYASAEGGPGEIIRSADPVDWVPRPAPVQHVRAAYGMLISGESMYPEFQPGEMAMCNPLLPIVNGATYIFYRERDGEARATIKRLVRATSDKWMVHQWNPPQGKPNDFTLDRHEWAIAHRVFGKQSL